MTEIEPLKPLVPQKLKFTLLDENDSDTEQTQENRMPFTITNVNNDLRCLPSKNIESEKMGRKVCDAIDKENDNRPSIENIVIGEVVVESQTQCERPVTPHDSEGVDLNQPLTPTANLKMLFSAVSPELRNRENKRLELFKAEQSDESLQELPVSMDADNEISASQESETGKPGSRKEKSLGLLCQKFLQKYPEYPTSDNKIQICLDEVAKDLGVERRRIYDIVNVLESVEVVSRMAKNKYAWHGKTNLVTTLAKLKVLGEAEGFLDQMHKLKDFELNRELDEQNENNSNSEKPSNKPTAESLGLGGTGVIRKDKSLGIMSQKFLMLFLVSKPRTVNLDQSAKILIGDPNVDRTENAKFKTKIRRLYDIANILTSLDLIRKVHVTEFRGRKPAFKYIGPDIDNVKGMDISCSDGCHRPTSRHSMLDCVQNQNGPSLMTWRSIHPAESTSVTGKCESVTKSTSTDQIEKVDENSLDSDKSLRKAFARHASFEQICQVAETERKKLYASASLPASPVKKTENKEDRPYVEEPTQTTSQIKHVILQHSGGKFHVIDESDERNKNPQPVCHHLPVQSITRGNTNKSLPKIFSVGSNKSPTAQETILIKTKPDVPGNRNQTLIPLTKDQIHAVLKSLKVPVPFNKDRSAIDTSSHPNSENEATENETSTTDKTEQNVTSKKRPYPDTEQSTPVEKRIKVMFPTPPSDNEDVLCEQSKEVPPKQLEVPMNSLPASTHVSTIISSTQTNICGITSSPTPSLVQMPFCSETSSKTFFMNSPLVSASGQPMQVIQGVPDGSGQSVNFVVPITYSPPLTPVSTASPTIFTFPATQSNVSFSPVHLLQPPVVKPITVSAIGNPVSVHQSTSLLQTPTERPVPVSPQSYYGNTPTSLLPVLSNVMQKTSRLAIPIVTKETAMSTARRLNLPPI